MRALLLLVLIILVGCSNESTVDREYDFEAALMPLDYEERNSFLAIVDDNMTRQERQWWAFPEEWEAYRIKLDQHTRFIDADGKEITKSDIDSHDYKFNVWTKERFVSEWSKVEEGTDMVFDIDLFPLYTVAQMQTVQMTDEEYLERSFSSEQETFAIEVIFTEEMSQEERSLIQETLREPLDNFRDQYNRMTLVTNKASERKERLLSIEDYPAFLVFDYEDLVFKTYDVYEFVDFLDEMGEE